MTDRARRAFSGIEILIVLGVMAALAGMSMPMLLTVMRRARVHDAGNAIMEVSAQARRLAKRCVNDDHFYGVRIVNEEVPRYVALTMDGNLLEEAGKPVSKLPLSANVVVFDGGSPLADGSPKSEWWYKPRTGEPIGSQKLTALAQTIRGLELRTIDGRLRSAVWVYSVGVVSVQDL